MKWKARFSKSYENLSWNVRTKNLTEELVQNLVQCRSFANVKLYFHTLSVWWSYDILIWNI